MKFWLVVGFVVSFFHVQGQNSCVLSSSGDEIDFFTVKLITTNGNQKILKASSFAVSVLDDAQTAQFRAYGHHDSLFARPFPKCFYLRPVITEKEEVFATANYGQKKSDLVPLNIRVLDADYIQSLGAQNVAQVLQQELNLTVGNDNVLGTTIQMQGMSGQGVKILLDGVPVVGRLNGQIDLSQFSTLQIERIEIIYGPMAVDFGADAVAGLINIITKKAKRKQLSVGGQYESSGVYNANLGFSYKQKKHGLNLSLERQFFDGYRLTDPAFQLELKGPADSTRAQSALPKETYLSNLNYSFTPDKTHTKFKGLQVSLSTMNDRLTARGLPRSPYYITAFDEVYQNFRYNGAVSLQYAPQKNQRFDFLIGVNHFGRIKNRYFVDLTNLQTELTTGSQDQDTTVMNAYMSRASYSWKLEKFVYTLGYDVQSFEMIGERLTTDKAVMGYGAAFGIVEWSPNTRLGARFGLRYNYHTVYQAPVLPTLSFLYQLSEKLKVRLQGGMGFRAPDVKELYFHFVDSNHEIYGNEELKPENSYTVQNQWSFTQEFKKKRQLTVELNPYFNYLHNGIQLVNTAPNSVSYTYRNVEEIRIGGLSSQAKIDFTKWNLGVGYMTNARQFTSLETGNQWLWNQQGNVQVSWKINANTKLQAFARINGAQPRLSLIDDQVSVVRGENFTLFDVNFQQRLFHGKWAYTLGIKNLLNVKTVSQTSSGQAHSSSSGMLVGFGRTYFVNLKYTPQWK